MSQGRGVTFASTHKMATKLTTSTKEIVPVFSFPTCTRPGGWRHELRLRSWEASLTSVPADYSSAAWNETNITWTPWRISNSDWFVNSFIMVVYEESEILTELKKSSQTSIIKYLQTSQNWIFFRQGGGGKMDETASAYYEVHLRKNLEIEHKSLVLRKWWASDFQYNFELIHFTNWAPTLNLPLDFTCHVFRFCNNFSSSTCKRLIPTAIITAFNTCVTYADVMRTSL